MRRPPSAALVLALAAALATSAGGTAPAQERAPYAQSQAWSGAPVDPARLLDSVVETIEKNFFDEQLLRQVDWGGRAQAVRASVLAAPTTGEAIVRINALLSELKTSHTALFGPDDYEYYILLDLIGLRGSHADLVSRRFWGTGSYYPGIGVFTRALDGRHFVDGILEGSPADRAGLRYGDEVLTVDGAPYSPVAAFRGKIGAMVALEFRREEGAPPRHVDVPVVPIRPTTAFAAATAASTRVIERNGRRIGYVHIWSSIDADVLKDALRSFDPKRLYPDWSMARTREEAQAARPLDSLVVDMRGRVGGNMSVAQQYLELLDQKPNPYWGEWRSVTRRGVDQRAREATYNPPFRGHSALLIDEHTRSAAEIMAFGYKRRAFGPIVGTPSAGAVSAAALFVMPGDLVLYVAVSGLEFFDGKRLEGVGVVPDHRVERPLPYAAGADPVLEAAVDLLASGEIK
jgi:carboxyl-terminal processing protease